MKIVTNGDKGGGGGLGKSDVTNDTSKRPQINYKIAIVKRLKLELYSYIWGI